MRILMNAVSRCRLGCGAAGGRFRRRGTGTPSGVRHYVLSLAAHGPVTIAAVDQHIECIDRHA